jgi:hypothetical protein
VYEGEHVILKNIFAFWLLNGNLSTLEFLDRHDAVRSAEADKCKTTKDDMKTSDVISNHLLKSTCYEI